MSYRTRHFLFLISLIGFIGATAVTTAGGSKAQLPSHLTVSSLPLPTPTSPVREEPQKDVWDKLDTISGCISAFFEIVAIIVGGIWTYKLFVRRRQKYPRAKIEHRITDRPIADGKVLVHVVVTISNMGEVLISLVSAETWIQKVLPLSPRLMKSINEGEDLVEEDKTEIQWPLIESRQEKWKKGECQIEPGEPDESRYDFVIDQDIQTIRVYSYYQNATERKREIGWQLATIYDLASFQRSKKTPSWYQRVLNLFTWR